MSERKYNSLTRNYTGSHCTTGSQGTTAIQGTTSTHFTVRGRRSGAHSPKCTRVSDDIPVKPPRPSYVLRRHERDHQRSQRTDRDFGGSLDSATNPKSPRNLEPSSPKSPVHMPASSPKSPAKLAAPRPANKRLSYRSDDKRKRFGTIQDCDEFQLPEKPSSAGASSKVGRYYN